MSDTHSLTPEMALTLENTVYLSYCCQRWGINRKRVVAQGHSLEAHPQNMRSHLGLLKINRLTGYPVLKARPVQKLPVWLTVTDRVMIQCLHITARRRAQISLPLLHFSLHYSTPQSEETSAVAFSTQKTYSENTCFGGRDGRSVVSTSLDQPAAPPLSLWCM